MRRRFGEEFKDELCREVISASKPIREVAESWCRPGDVARVVGQSRDANDGTETELPVEIY